LGHGKCFLKLIWGIGFQFWEPLRDALHWGSFDFVILTPLKNTVMYTDKNMAKTCTTIVIVGEKKITHSRIQLSFFFFNLDGRHFKFV